MKRRALAMITLAALLATATPAGALTRLEIVSRAQRWVELGVPYSQSSRFEGYRQDCSGMASMAWTLPMPGASTRTLAPYGTLISRDDLQPGDMLLKYDYHAVIFYKWANAQHTSYWTLEQSSSAGHAVARLTPYPYWSQQAAGFSAYRPDQVTEVDDYGTYVTSVAGADRYATAFAASRRAFADGSADSVVVCSGENWPDALGGSALAGAVEGPILLTPAATVPGALATEIARLGAHNVVIVGGASAVSTGVAEAIEDMPGVGSVTRIGGKNRYETAALVARETVRVRKAGGLSYDGGVYIATGGSFPDALGAATAAAYTGRPVLLSLYSTIPTDTAEAIEAIGARDAWITGGTAALSPAVESQLADAGIDESVRLAGKDRYETALLLAEHAVDEGLSWDGLGIATGSSFADALAGAVMQARLGSALVLTPSQHLDPSTDAAIRGNLDRIETTTVFGGDAAVSRLARRQIRWIMDEP